MLLGGAVASVFSAELLLDYPEVFQKQQQRDLVQITFGAPRVFDKLTALKLNGFSSSAAATHFRHLRFVNEKDMIPTLPHWQMKSLYHTGDCCFAEDNKRLWFTIRCTNLETHQEDQDFDQNQAEAATSPLNPTTTTATAALMSMNHRRFNFASDGHTDADSFAEILMHFTIGGADAHAMSQAGGYLDQIVHSLPYQQAVAQSSEIVQSSFKELPMEISQANETAELGKAVASLGLAMGKLFED